MSEPMGGLCWGRGCRITRQETENPPSIPKSGVRVKQNKTLKKNPRKSYPIPPPQFFNPPLSLSCPSHIT